MKIYLKIGAIVFLMIAFFVLLNLTSFSKKVKNFFYLISEPIQKWLWKIGMGVSDFFEAISEMKNLKKENEELKSKIQELLAENTALKELKEENEILREALNLGLGEEFVLNLSQVIGKEISKDSLIINRGSVDGITIGLPVITQQKALVGKISEVYENFSKVQLLTLKDNSFDVKISEKEIYGLAKGKGNFKLSLELIPREKEIKIGDKIITVALGGNFPLGLLIGEAQKIKKSDIEPFQTAEIKPAFEIGDLDYLFIITNFKP
ncbi:MAG: rod shape-determining protein MreC [Candidatus Paceibacterales bacterium]